MKINEGTLTIASGWPLLTPGPWSPAIQGVTHPIPDYLSVTTGGFLALSSRILSLHPPPDVSGKAEVEQRCARRF